MPVTEIKHSESWALTITPDEGESWPETKDPTYSRATVKIVPDKIFITVRPGSPYTGTVQGFRVGVSGEPTRARSHFTFHGDRGCPEWAQVIIEHELQKHRLLQYLGEGD